MPRIHASPFPFAVVVLPAGWFMGCGCGFGAGLGRFAGLLRGGIAVFPAWCRPIFLIWMVPLITAGTCLLLLFPTFVL